MIVGAPKAGTTSLCHYLSEHPQVFMSDPKEVNFFSKEEIENQGLYYNDFKVKNIAEYEDLFAGVTNEIAVGEGSVSYLFYPKTPQKIKDALPNVKIIILLRDPVSRGFSHYLMDYRLGLVDVPYDEIVYQKSNHKNNALYYQQYVELGLYYEQVRRYLDIFGIDQVRIFINDDLKEDISKVILSVYDFLDIDQNFMPDLKKQYNVYQKPRNAFVSHLYSAKPLRRLARTVVPHSLVDTVKNTLLVKEKKPELSPGTRKYLNGLFKNNILQTADLIDRDLSHWCRD